MTDDLKPKPSIHDNPLDGLSQKLTQATQAEAQGNAEGYVFDSLTNPLRSYEEAVDESGRVRSAAEREAADTLKSTAAPWADAGKSDPALAGESVDDLKALLEKQARDQFPTSSFSRSPMYGPDGQEVGEDE